MTPLRGIFSKRDGEKRSRYHPSCYLATTQAETITNKTAAAAALSRSGRCDERFEPLYPRLEEIFGG